MPKLPKRDFPRSPHHPEGTIDQVRPNGEAVLGRDAVQETAAKLYGQGVSRSNVAKVLYKHLTPRMNGRPKEHRLATARTKLRRWETTQKFRDLVYQHAVVELDLVTPTILQGVARRASKKGDVQAARLILEVTGRHNPKGDIAVAQINLHMGNIPRPQMPTEEEIVEGELVDED